MIPQIKPTDLCIWFASLGSGQGLPIVLDVREPWELQTASIKPDGFELLAIPMGDIPSRLADLPPDRPIACMCHHGARSQRVAGFLVQQGYASVANIAGGINAWSTEVDSAIPHY